MTMYVDRLSLAEMSVKIIRKLLARRAIGDRNRADGEGRKVGVFNLSSEYSTKRGVKYT